MNQFKNKNTEQVSAKDKPKKSFVRPLVDVLSGKILTTEAVVKNLGYMVFLVFLALVYIANGYKAEDTVRQMNAVSNELKELRSEYITTKSDLMYTTKQSELTKILESRSLGIVESLEPPKKIVVSKSERKAILKR